MSRLDYPATSRNKEAIANALANLLPDRGSVLEVASGSGQHCVYFAKKFPDLVFHPSDPDADGRASIASWTKHFELENVREPLDIDCMLISHETKNVLGKSVSGESISPNVIFCANMIHIASWQAAIGLVTLAGNELGSGEPLILYGPFWIKGRVREPSNLAFDESLRQRNPEWGIRSLEEIMQLGLEHSMQFETVLDLPANNVIVVLRHI